MGLTVGSLPLIASAQRSLTTWTSAVGDFAAAASWSAGIPSSSVDAKIDNSGTARLTSPVGHPAAYVFLGSALNTAGTLEISGAGSVALTSMVVGGRGGSGLLQISNGGKLTSYGGVMAADISSTGTAIVDGSGSRWTVTGPEMRIGSIGNGVLSLQNGAGVTVANGSGKIMMGSESVGVGSLFIGNGTMVGDFSVGEVYVGAGKATVTFNHTNPSLVIATKFTGVKNYNGYGFLDLVHSGPGTTILTAPESNLDGLVTVSGGTLLVNGKLMGSLRDTVVDDQIVTEKNIGEVHVQSGGNLGGTGFIEGKTTIEGGLTPGSGLGTLKFGGDLDLTSNATLTLELGGRVRGTSFDAINVAGALHYGGTLRVSLVNGFVPADLDSFDLFNEYSSFTGSFSRIEFTATGYSGAFNPQTGVLAVHAIPEPTVSILSTVAALAISSRRRRAFGRGKASCECPCPNRPE